MLADRSRSSTRTPRGGGGYSWFKWCDRRILGGLKFSIPGCFWVGKFGKYFFVWLDLSGDLSRVILGIQNILKIGGSARVVLQIKYNQICFAVVFQNNTLKYLTHYIAYVS